LCLPLLFACQSNQNLTTTQSVAQPELYLDQQFILSENFQIETEQEIFQIDDAMRAMVETKLTNNFSAHQKARILLEHLFNEENIALSYDERANVTATQAYHNKSANCMSLTIMAYAMATHAGMNIAFQEVNIPEYWVRNGQYSLLTGHVNLLVKPNEDVNRNVIWGEKATRIDFDPFIAKKDFPAKIITKHRLLSMFYNNKGAEELINGNFELAYHYLKQATLTDNQFASAWGNLGILYKKTGHFQLAESAYRHAISIKSDSLTSLGNLAILLNKQGRVEEAAPIDKYLHKIRSRNPYYHALLGNEALYYNDYSTALKHFKKSIVLDDEQHEFYLGLAKVYYMQGRLSLAKRSMNKAITLTKAKDTHRLYIAKLNFLKHKESL